MQLLELLSNRVWALANPDCTLEAPAYMYTATHPAPADVSPPPTPRRLFRAARCCEWRCRRASASASARLLRLSCNRQCQTVPETPNQVHSWEQRLSLLAHSAFQGAYWSPLPGMACRQTCNSCDWPPAQVRQSIPAPRFNTAARHGLQQRNVRGHQTSSRMCCRPLLCSSLRCQLSK